MAPFKRLNWRSHAGNATRAARVLRHKTTYCVTIARVSTYLVGIGRLVDRHFLCFHREDEEITQTHIHGALKSDLTRFFAYEDT